MQEVVSIGCGLVVWMAAYFILSRLMFRSRRKDWERFEDMTNEGCQTTVLLLVSGVIGGVAAITMFVMWLWD